MASIIWDNITNGSIIEGHFDDKRPNEYQSADYGTLYRNTITNIICNKFGAERKHTRNGNVLRFDPEKLVKVGSAYNIKSRIQTKVIEDGSEGCEGSPEGASSHIQNSDVKYTNNLTNKYGKSSYIEMNTTNSATQNDDRPPSLRGAFTAFTQ